MTKKEAEIFAKTTLAKSGLHLMKGSVDAKVSPKAVSFANKIADFIQAWKFVNLADSVQKFPQM